MPSAGSKIRNDPQLRQTKSEVVALLGAQKWWKMLRDPCIPRDPQRQAREAKLEVVPQRGKNQKWLLTLSF